MPKCLHNFVPVDVLWINLWGAMKGDPMYTCRPPRPPKVGWVVLACKCGAVKVVKARLVNGKSMLEEYQKMKT